MRSVLKALVSAAVLTSAAPARAQSPVAGPGPSLGLPLACEIGRTCEIQHYVDRDPGPGALDYRCGHRTYDKHNGVDIRLLDMGAERAGTNVLAAAAGLVSRLRDEAPDISIRALGAPSVAGKECGNGVVIDHGGGWETQYCHLQRGSIRVKAGDRVSKGQPIARAGLSGDTEFAHLHFTVRQATRIIDPFAPDMSRPTECGTRQTPMWDPAAARGLTYKAGAVLNAGWAAGPVTLADVEAGGITGPTGAAPAVVAYFRLIGLEAGDIVQLTVTGPSGEMLVKTRTPPLDHDKDEYIAVAGKKHAVGTWPRGVYSAQVQVLRGGRTAVARQVQLRL